MKEGAAKIGRSIKLWRRLEVAIDSGACDNVIDPDELPEHEVRETRASKDGDEFSSATGEPIPNLGEMSIMMVTRERTTRAMTFTACPVAKPLASVKRICSAGHVVIFDEEGSYILNKHTGQVTNMMQKNGVYMIEAWVLKPSMPVCSRPGR